MSNDDHHNIAHLAFSNITFKSIPPENSNKNFTASRLLINGNWHLGPLKERNDKALSAWFSEHFGYIPDNLSTDAPTANIDSTSKIFAWVNSASSEEYANFLRWTSSQRPKEFFLISPPYLSTRSIVGDFHEVADLADGAIKKKSIDVDSYIEEWSTLIDENSDFRLINPAGKIQSFTSSHFDKYIMDSITRTWEPSPTVVLRIMEKLDSETQGSPGDIFFYNRLEKLFMHGMLEKQADVTITQTRIRATNP